MPGGFLYHASNRASAGVDIFACDVERDQFAALLAEAQRRVDDCPDLLAWCAVPGEWHALLRSRVEGDVSQFLRWVSMRHAQQHHHLKQTSGGGSIYRGRFRSYPVMAKGTYPFAVSRYIESLPRRRGHAETCDLWRSSSALDRCRPEEVASQRDRFQLLPLCEWPGGDQVDVKAYCLLLASEQPRKEVEAIEKHLSRGRPFGEDEWVQCIAREMNLLHTLRPRGRPRRDASAVPLSLHPTAA